MANVRLRSIELHEQNTSARVYDGGDGPVLLLVHGGWGGASHWSRVWDALARRHRVVAPDLPGLGAIDATPLPSVAAYAQWLVALLDTLRIRRAVCVGNSFGGSVVWSLAGRFPERCSGLVLVDGIPMPGTPLPLLRFGRTRFGAALMRWGVRRFSYHPKNITRAFVDASRAPGEMVAMLSTPNHPIVSRFASIVIEGDGPPRPALKPLLLWGAGDRLLGTRLTDARRLHARLEGSELCVILGAGHFPQLEVPGRFVEELERWCDAQRNVNPKEGLE